MKVLLIGLSFVLTSIMSVAQTFKIKVSDSNRKPVIGATLLLKSQPDTTIVLGGIADSLGMVSIEAKDLNYLLLASAMGYQPVRKGIRFASNMAIIDVIMKEDAKNLSEVTIRAQKPLVTQEEDKMIVDPEPLAATSTSAYEIMEKTPGLFIDQEGNIYLSSATQSTIYINGREQKMSANDVASILKSLPPNSIEKIEIMRTPSAKYDASGSGGIVNIVLKKGVKIGLTGSINAGHNQGRFSNQTVGVNLSNVDGGNSMYLNLSYGRRNSYDSLLSVRNITKDLMLSQRAYTNTPSQSLYAGFGMGRELSKKLEVNADTRLSYNPSASTTTNVNTQSAAQVLNFSTNTVANDAKTISFEQGFTTKYKIDTVGSELTTDWSYNYFNRTNDQNISTLITIPQRLSLIGLGQIHAFRHSLAGQIDLKYKLKYKITFETGIKTSYQNFESDTKYFNQKDQQTTVDTKRTNQYQYQENIHAAYFQASKPLGSLLLKTGIRVENTNMDGSQIVPLQSNFKINRTDWFPYLYLSRQLANVAGYELRAFLIARRSIARPMYEYLNPSIRVIDQYLYETGNPSLKPQFTQTYEANISVEDRPLFAIGRSYTQDIFTNVVYQDKENKAVTYRTYDNLGSSQETYFRAIAGIPPIGRYFFVLTAQYNLNDYAGLYENAPLNFKRGSWRIFTYQQLRIDKRSSLTLNGFLMLKGQMQFYELGNFGMLNMVLNRSFLNRKLTVTINAADFLFTMPNDFVLNQGSISAYGRRQSDTRRFGVNIRYNFGIRKREEGNNLFKLDSDL